MSKLKSVPDPVIVCCPHCQGRGTRRLSPAYFEALVALRAQDREIHGAALARVVGIEPTAMNNRLATLGWMGLATSRVEGRNRLWTATIPQKRERTENAESPPERTKREGREKRRRCEA